MQDDDTTRAGGSEGASAPARVEDAQIPLEAAWSRWALASRGGRTGRRDEPSPTDVLAEALDRAPTSEILELFIRGAHADIHDQKVTSWSADRKPLADEIDRRIPRRRA